MNINTIVDNEYADKNFRDICNAPLSALRGVSKKDGPSRGRVLIRYALS